jgi:steroid 5-alpha reductase family enzyme
MMTTLTAGYAALFLMMCVVWVLARERENAAVVDVAWGAGFFLFAGIAALRSGGADLRTGILAAMIMLWSGRLALHLLYDRILSGGPEDERYQEIRARWKTNLGVKFFLFFQLQAALIAALSVPFVLVMNNPEPSLSWLEWAGIAAWCAALAGESAADRQLARFKADPANKGKVCRAGLWNYSRHPNYFFEWCTWIAFLLFALPSPYGWTAAAGPLVMYVVLTRMTGIPLTEEHALRSRGSAYRAYQESTSPFIPWFPKSAGGHAR